MKNSRYTLLLILVLFGVCAAIAQTPMPYFTSFEKEKMGDEWFSVSREKYTDAFWMIGKDIHHMGAYSMYVSVDSVTANYQAVNSGYMIYAYKEFELEAGTYRLDFDYCIGGNSIINESMKVALVPSSITVNAGSTGNFSTTIAQYYFADAIEGADEWGPTGGSWKSCSGNIAVTTPGSYKLMFFFRQSGSEQETNPPGAAIDNLSFGIVPSDRTACNRPPISLRVVNDPDLAMVFVYWSGNAPSYDLLCYSYHDSRNTSYIERKNITDQYYVFMYEDIPEGTYSFAVRAVCDDGTKSVYTKIDNQLIINPYTHCINYNDLHSDLIKCYSGTYSDTRATEGVIDNGPSDWRNSIHTVHFDPTERDPLTGYKLKTVPDGYYTSVRVGCTKNGPKQAKSAAIDFYIKPKADQGILLINYAAVLEYQRAHPPSQQTSIRVQVFPGKIKSHGTVVPIACADADFNAKDVDDGNLRGWHTFQPDASSGLVTDDSGTIPPIKWLDWSRMGMDLSAYTGQWLTVRVTLFCCVADFHCAYGYFAFDCIPKQLTGVACGSIAEEISAPEGFKYRWYVKDDPKKTVVSTSRVFDVKPTDTNSYCVDVISLENDRCYFTLTAYTTPRAPVPRIEYELNQEDCQNVIKLINKSGVYIKNGETEELDPTAELEYVIWEFENPQYGMSAKDTITLNLPPEGGKLNFSLYAKSGACDSTVNFSLDIPAAAGSITNQSAFICEGESYWFKGKEYTEPGVYRHSSSNSQGCDDVTVLTLDVMPTESVELGDIEICSDALPYEFNGYKIDKEGEFNITQKSKGGCDSVYYHGNIVVTNSLHAGLEVDLKQLVICNDDGSVDLPFYVDQGELRQYKIEYDEFSRSQGFSNMALTDLPENNIISMPIPYNIRPDYYHGTLYLINEDCGNIVIPLDFVVRYPASVIKQLWNDVLAIRNSDYNGGYNFSTVQWYCDGKPLMSHSLTATQLYKEGEQLNFEGRYHAVLTRIDDNHAVPTCFYEPIKFGEGTINDTQIKSVVFKDEMIPVESTAAANVAMYNMQGMQIGTFRIEQGQTSFKAPLQAGVYLLYITYDDNTTKSIKFVVK